MKAIKKTQANVFVSRGVSFFQILFILLFLATVFTNQVYAAKGTLSVGYAAPARKWNPHLNTAAIQLTYLRPVYEALVGEDETGNPFPLLAESWDWTDDAITFTLRDNITFHDGVKFDAHAVKANIDDVRSGKFPANAAKLSAISEVEVIDSLHVRFHLSKPAPNLLYNLQRFAGLMVSPAALKSGDVDRAPIGTGPWKLNKDKTLGDTRYVYELNENYWNPSVQGVENIEIYVINPRQQWNGFISNTLDVARVINSFLPQAKMKGYKILAPEGPHVGIHILDQKGRIVPELADPRVRRALSLAIDRKVLFRVVMGDYGTTSTQRYLPGDKWYSDEIEDLSYNPEKAKQLLAEAGVKNLTFDTFSQNKFWDDWCQPISAMFKKIGVKMNIKRIPVGQLYVAGASGKWPVAILPIIERHPIDFYEARIAKDANLNPFHYEDKELESIVARASKIRGSQADPLWAEMNRQIAEKGYIIHLGSMQFPVVVSNRVKNISGLKYCPANVIFRDLKLED